jgi:hypothetical protein
MLHNPEQDRSTYIGLCDGLHGPSAAQTCKKTVARAPPTVFRWCRFCALSCSRRDPCRHKISVSQLGCCGSSTARMSLQTQQVRQHWLCSASLLAKQRHVNCDQVKAIPCWPLGLVSTCLCYSSFEFDRPLPNSCCPWCILQRTRTLVKMFGKRQSTLDVDFSWSTQQQQLVNTTPSLQRVQVPHSR